MLQTDSRDEALDLLRSLPVSRDEVTALTAIGYALCAVVERLDALIEQVQNQARFNLGERDS